MSLDEDVLIKMNAEHAQALAAFEAISEATRKFGEQVKQTGEALGLGADKGASGFEKLSEGIDRATDMAEPFSQALEMINRQLEQFAEKGKKALDVQLEMAGTQRNWQDFLKPGESAGAIDKRLEQIGAGGMGYSGAAGAFAQLIAGRKPGQTTDDLLGLLAEASKSTPDRSRAASRAGQIGALMRGGFGFTAEGASAELTRLGFGERAEAESESVRGLGKLTGGRDSYQTLAGFFEGLGQHADRTSSEKLAEHIQATSGTHSIGDALRFYRAHPEMMAALNNVQLQRQLGIRDPEIVSSFRDYVRAGAGPSAAGVNDPRTIAAMRKQQAEIAADPNQQLAAFGRIDEGEVGRIQARDPAGVFEEARKSNEEALTKAGYGDSTLGTRQRIRTEFAGADITGSSPYTTEEQKAEAKRRAIQESQATVMSQAASATDPANRGILEAQEKHLANLVRLFDVMIKQQAQKGEHHDTPTAAAAAGG